MVARPICTKMCLAEHFILPLLLIPSKFLEGYTKVFVKNSHKPLLERHVFILYRMQNVDIKHIERLETFNSFYEIEYFKEYVLLTFVTPEIFKEDLLMFEKGSYSKFSSRAKSAILAYYGKYINGKRTFHHTALNPTKETLNELSESLDVYLEHDAEVCSSPYINEETFSLNKIYNLIL